MTTLQLFSLVEFVQAYSILYRFFPGLVLLIMLFVGLRSHHTFRPLKAKPSIDRSLNFDLLSCYKLCFQDSFRGPLLFSVLCYSS
jgi:hypothetical protein